MQRLAEEHQQSLDEVFRANGDLAARLKSQAVSLRYDPDDDVVILTIGERLAEGVYESVKNRLFLRLDPDSLKIVEMEIPDASVQFRDDPNLGPLLQSCLPGAGRDTA